MCRVLTAWNGIDCASGKIDWCVRPVSATYTKTDLIETFGSPEWCKMEESGSETCRFYRKKGTRWIGDKKQKDKKPIETGDQVIAEFDKEGILRSFKASAQR